MKHQYSFPRIHTYNMNSCFEVDMQFCVIQAEGCNLIIFRLPQSNYIYICHTLSAYLQQNSTCRHVWSKSTLDYGGLIPYNQNRLDY